MASSIQDVEEQIREAKDRAEKFMQQLKLAREQEAVALKKLDDGRSKWSLNSQKMMQTINQGAIVSNVNGDSLEGIVAEVQDSNIKKDILNEMTIITEDIDTRHTSLLNNNNNKELIAQISELEKQLKVHKSNLIVANAELRVEKAHRQELEKRLSSQLIEDRKANMPSAAQVVTMETIIKNLQSQLSEKEETIKKITENAQRNEKSLSSHIDELDKYCKELQSQKDLLLQQLKESKAQSDVMVSTLEKSDSELRRLHNIISLYQVSNNNDSRDRGRDGSRESLSSNRNATSNSGELLLQPKQSSSSVDQMQVGRYNNSNSDRLNREMDATNRSSQEKLQKLIQEFRKSDEERAKIIKDMVDLDDDDDSLEPKPPVFPMYKLNSHNGSLAEAKSRAIETTSRYSHNPVPSAPMYGTARNPSAQSASYSHTPQLSAPPVQAVSYDHRPTQHYSGSSSSLSPPKSKNTTHSLSSNSIVHTAKNPAPGNTSRLNATVKPHTTASNTRQTKTLPVNNRAKTAPQTNNSTKATTTLSHGSTAVGSPKKLSDSNDASKAAPTDSVSDSTSRKSIKVMMPSSRYVENTPPRLRKTASATSTPSSSYSPKYVVKAVPTGLTKVELNDSRRLQKPSATSSSVTSSLTLRNTSNVGVTSSFNSSNSGGGSDKNNKSNKSNGKKAKKGSRSNTASLLSMDYDTYHDNSLESLSVGSLDDTTRKSKKK
jgi:hypothetical protein